MKKITFQKPTFLLIITLLGIAFLFNIEAYSQLPQPILNYPFEGNSNDYSGNAYNLNAYGCSLVAGKHAQTYGAYYFNGYSEMSSSFGIPFILDSASFTINTWIKVDSLSSNLQALFYQSDVDANYLFGLKSGYPVLNVDTSTTAHLYYSNTQVPTNTFAMLTVTRQWGGAIKFYLNGTDISDGDSVNAESYETYSGLYTYVGTNDNESFPHAFIGVIDHLRIYDTVLTPVQVSSLYSADMSYMRKITLSYDMRVQHQMGNFVYGTDAVEVIGSWNDYGVTPLSDGNNDTIFTATTFTDSIGKTLSYKGRYNHGGSYVTELNYMPERKLLVPDFEVDTVIVFDNTVYQSDLAVVSLVSPINGARGMNEPVTVLVRNQGQQPISGFNISFNVNGSNYFYETDSTVLNSGDYYWYTFPQTVDMSLSSKYDFNITVNMSGDQDYSNDHLMVPLNNVPNLQAHYDFNNNTNDQSGEGHHIDSYSALPDTNRFGVANEAFYFDGATSFMQNSSHLKLYGNTNNLTVSFWVKPMGNSGMLLYQNDNYQDLYFGLNNLQPVVGSKDFMQYRQIEYVSDQTLTLGQWYHLTFTIDSRDTVVIYVNGVQTSQSFNSFEANGMAQYTLQQWFGYNGLDSITHFVGAIDDIKIYSKAQTAGEIAARFSLESNPVYDVTFNVNMKYQAKMGYFNPATDFVDLAGTFNTWGTARVDTMYDIDQDSIYTIVLPGQQLNDSLQFKFRVNGKWTAPVEGSISNRVHVVIDGLNEYTAYFDNKNYQSNLTALAAVAPVWGETSSTAQVALAVKNTGNNVSSAFTATYYLNGAGPFTDTVYYNLQSGETYNHYFNQLANLSVPDVYNFYFSITPYGQDDDPNDNQLEVQIRNLAVTDSNLQMHLKLNGNAYDYSGYNRDAYSVYGIEYNDSSMYFGNASYMSADFRAPLGLIDFSIETQMRIYEFNTQLGAASYNTWFSMADATRPNYFVVSYNATNGNWNVLYNNTSYTFADTAVRDYGWHTVAVERFESKLSFYVDGNSVGIPASVDNVPLQVVQNGFYVAQELDSLGVGAYNINTSLNANLRHLKVRKLQALIPDIALGKSLNPLYACGADPLTVGIKLINNGMVSVSDIPVAYKLNGGSPVWDTVPGPLLPNDTLDYYFSAKANISHSSYTANYTLKTWCALPADVTKNNDTVSRSFTVYGNFTPQKGWQAFTPCDGLSDRNSFALAQGPDGNVWSTNFYGVNRIASDSILTYTQSNGLIDNYSWNILASQSGDIWLPATTKGGFSQYNGVNFITHFPFDSAIFEECSYQDPSGNLWFGSYSGMGLAKYNGTTWTHYPNEADTIILAIGSDYSGKILFSNSNRVTSYDGTNFANYPINGISKGASEILYENGRTWFWSDKLEVNSKGVWTDYTSKVSSIGWIEAIEVDAKGNVWFGGYDGAACFKTDGTWSYFNATNGLLATPIYAVLCHSDGSVYFGSYMNGLMRYLGTLTVDYTLLQSADTVSFTPVTNADNPSYFWDFGDGKNSTLANPLHVYAKAGVYNACLKVYDASRDTTVSVCYPINIVDTSNATCLAYFSYTSLADTVYFKNLANSATTDYLWDFGDGVYSVEKDPQHRYAKGGYFDVTLTAFNPATNCIDMYTQTLAVKLDSSNNCLARFTYSALNNTVTFKNESNGTFSQVFWSFGDGSYSYSINPVYTYNETGNYEVVLTVFNDITNCMDNYTQTVMVIDPQQAYCQADFNFMQNGLTVSFTDKSIGSPKQYFYDFGDFTNSNQSSPVKVYSKPGYYQVSYTIMDTLTGCFSSITKMVYVEETPGSGPTGQLAADFSYMPQQNTLTANFKDESLGAVSSWYWDFGDNTPASSLKNPEHTYAINDYFRTCLTVENTTHQSTNCEFIAIGDVTNSITAFFNYFADSVTSTAHFKNKSLGNIQAYHWDFGDGNYSAQKNPSHTYADTGYYAVSLTTTGPLGNTKTYMQTILIGNAISNPCKYSCVWPGDANSDLEANHYDIMTIGLNYGMQGPRRENASTAWYGQFAQNWSTYQLDSTNNKHGDANGDGQINFDDVPVIEQNFGYSHYANPEFKAGEWVMNCEWLPNTKATRSLSRATLTRPTSKDPGDIYAIGFEIEVMGGEKIIWSNIDIDFANCWIGTDGVSMLTVNQIDSINHMIYIGLTRIDQQNVTGEGELCKIEFDFKPGYTKSGVSFNVTTRGGIVSTGNPVTVGGSIELSLDSVVYFCQGTEALIDAGTGFKSYTWSNGVTDTSRIEVSEAGLYSVTVTNEAGQSASATIRTEEIELPTVDLGDDIVNNGSVTLDAGSGFASYLWSTNDTTSSILVEQTGTYFVIVESEQGCSNSDTINVQILTGLNNITKLEGAIFPNPNNGKFWLVYEFNSQENLILEIVNVEGRLVWRKEVKDHIGQKLLIDPEFLSKGVYTLKILNGNEHASLRFVVLL